MHRKNGIKLLQVKMVFQNRLSIDILIQRVLHDRIIIYLTWYHS
nr:MAG TPA: envelope glycoprotein [Bacteriophage sp.]DAT27341.1 MAG TPA: envelope glycoprotein [Caudoviricetes sp.]